MGTCVGCGSYLTVIEVRERFLRCVNCSRAKQYSIVAGRCICRADLKRPTKSGRFTFGDPITCDRCEQEIK